MKNHDIEFQKLWLGFRNSLIEATTPKKRKENYRKYLDAENLHTIFCIADDAKKGILEN